MRGARDRGYFVVKRIVISEPALPVPEWRQSMQCRAITISDVDHSGGVDSHPARRAWLGCLAAANVPLVQERSLTIEDHVPWI